MSRFTHEQPVDIDFTHRIGTQPTADYGERFNQHVEPAGKYLAERYESANLPTKYGDPKDWGGATYFEHGTVHFEKPYVIHMAEGESPLEWKKTLSAANGGKVKSALSNHLRRLGYDGIVVVHADGHVAEMVSLGARETIVQPMPPEAPRRPTPRAVPVKKGPRFERVRFNDGDKVKAVFLRIEKDGPRFLTGIEVDKYTDEIAGHDFDERTRMIAKGAIVSRREYVLDPTYAELVPKRREGR